MNRVFALVLLIAGAISSALPLFAQNKGEVLVLQVKGVIDPLVAQYIARGVEAATQENATVLVIELDTPGGLDTSMREIVQAILNSPVPVVVYVAPSGARAGSAGVFITLAAHIAAMAPSTNIGAAHPVALGEGEIEGTLQDKITNDAAAYIRSIAQTRGRNADWAEQAVRQSVSVTEEEALELKVIDLVAASRDELLAEIDERRIETSAGARTILASGARVRLLEMTLAERLVHALVDPNIAYLLFTLGIWALVAEFYNPGTVIPGATGIILLILAFIALGSLPLNWGGLALILLAIFLFILDIKVTGFALSVFGGIAFILGSLILFSPFTPTTPAAPRVAINPWLIAGMTAALLGFFLFVVSKGLATRRLPVAMGDTRRLLGTRGVASTRLAPEGTVLLKSEDWTAVSEEGEIPAGEEVEVVGVEGLRLRVRRVLVTKGD